MSGIRPRLVLFGDSLTEFSFGEGGWGAALQNLFARKADVVLRGLCGYNSRWVLPLLPKIFPPEGSREGDVAVVTVFFGANDAALPDQSAGWQHVPVEEYQANLGKIVKAIQESSPTAKIVLITPPPVDDEGRLRFIREEQKDNALTISERTNESAGKYAAACKAVAKDLGLPVVDLWAKLQERPSWHLLFNDGLHFTPAGSAAVYEEVYSVIKIETPLACENLPWDFAEFTTFRS